MSKYKGLFTFDEDNHRYVPIAQADGIIDTMDYEPGSEPAEPLIKDGKIRKAVRAWAEINDIKEITYNYSENSLEDIFRNTITFNMGLGLKDGKKYTITELCGEEEE